MAELIEMTDEQAMLLDTAVDFCREHAPMDAVRSAMARDESVDEALWRQMAELGWMGIIVPAEHGGLGLTPGDLVPVAEAMGRRLLGSPFFASTLAARAIDTSGSGTQKSAWLPRIAGGAVATVALTESDGNWRLDGVTTRAKASGDELVLTGSKTFVLDAAAAEVFVVSCALNDETRLVLVERERIPENAIVRDVVIDETRRSYTVDFDDVSIPADQLMPKADLEAIEQLALLMLSAEIAGGLAGVLQVIVDYLTTRKQFDKLIGSYQALKHPTVQILLAAEAARSHVYHAATAMTRGDRREIAIALHMAKAQGSAAFAWAGDRAIQFHGGFGFTWECDAQLFLRRALWCQYQFGDERYHRERLARLLLDASA